MYVTYISVQIGSLRRTANKRKPFIDISVDYPLVNDLKGFKTADFGGPKNKSPTATANKN